MLQEPKKKKKINPLLMKVIIISLAIHGIGGLVAAVYTIRTLIIQDAQFEEPPPTDVEEPPPEVKVEIEPEQPVEQFEQKLTMPSVADIAIGDVDLSLPEMDQGFTVSGAIGNIGGGNLLRGARGNIGIGLSDADIFGIKSRAERFLVVIDANRRMVSDDKGGLNSYQVIKDEVTNVVKKFKPGTLFNVLLFDQNKVVYFNPKLVPSNKDIHQELVEWIKPVNSNPTRIGLEGDSRAAPIKLNVLPNELVHRVLPNIQWAGNQVGLITQLALEQNADAVFFITGYHRGFEDLRRPMNASEAAEWKRVVESPTYQKKLAKHNAEIPEMRQRISKELKEINEERAQRGQPPRILKNPGNIYMSSEELGLDWKNRHPGDAPSFVIKPAEIKEYFEKVMEKIYPKQANPSINVILFLSGDEQFHQEWERQLDKYVRFFDGKSRLVRGADGIKRAAKNTKAEASSQ